MKASRGDLVAIVRTTHDYAIGHGSTERTSVALGVVTSVTRDGVVKAFREGDYSPRALATYERSLIVSADTIDVSAALDAYSLRRYPSAPHSTMVPPFDSVESARAFLRAFLSAVAA